MPQNIRNFAIIAHIDHGKSTLADRFLEITKTVSKEKMMEQFLDQNPISRERGITIKLAPVRMVYRNPKSEIRNPRQYQNSNNKNSKPFKNFENSDLFRASGFGIRALEDSEYILNLIDTPGHVDFSYEVSRTLACCEGVVLLVDATQGIQAQTVAHYNDAKKQNLTVIPVVNKIDAANADPKKVADSMCETFGFNKDEILYISAKTGENVENLLLEIIKRIPSPRGNHDYPLRALVFDAVYDEHRGVVAFVRVVDGEVGTRDKIKLIQSNFETIVTEVGFFSPFLTASGKLGAGEIGYIITGIKDIRQCRVGDTITISKIKDQRSNIRPLPGYEPPKPMVFFGVYPKSTDELVRLKEGLNRISLKDASLTFSEEHSSFLGSGFRVGFLGLLHAEIVKERLKQEEGADPLFTIPQVLYKRTEDKFLEPYINLTIYAPAAYVGGIMTTCQKRKGRLSDTYYFDTYTVLKYEMPYSMFIRGISSEIKSISSGFASIDYELAGYREADLVNLEILINGTGIDILSELVYRGEAIYKAGIKTKKLKDTLTRQQYRQIIQGVIEGKIVAREELSPFRKDVIAKLSGGDRTRKDKLLKKQKKGKERLKNYSKTDIPQEALYSFLE